MPGVFFITGKLGAGKGLVSVGKIKDYLERGKPVATNLDIFLHHMFPKTTKDIRLIRLPDKPLIDDFEMIGRGNESYDQRENGLLCLDECGDWLNTRDFRDKDRPAILTWFRHARKKGWDILFQVQDISLLDKHVISALAEHVVYCRRMDRLAVPIFGYFFKFLFGRQMPLPQVHVANVFYGMSKMAPKVDTWTYYGTSLYSCYDTNQEFVGWNPEFSEEKFRPRPCSMLPPFYTHYKTISERNKRFYMRVTKIYLKRFNRPLIFAVGFMFCLAVSAVFKYGVAYASSKPSLAKRFGIVSSDEKIYDFSDKSILEESKIKTLSKSALEDPREVVTQDEQLFEEKRLNWVLYYKNGEPVTRIVFDGRSYYLDELPFNVSWKRGEPYAFLPVEKEVEENGL